MTDKTRSKFSV